MKRILLSLIIAVAATLIIFLLLFRPRQNRLDVSPEVQRKIDGARRR